MKRTEFNMEAKKVFMCLLNLLFLAGCVIEHEHHVNGSTPDETVAARFTAHIANVATRATNNTWGPNDSVGIFMVKHGTTEIVDGVDNRHYKVDAQGVLSPATADQDQTIYLPQNGETVDFIACYPYRSTITGLSSPYTLNVSGDQTGRLSALDLLYATATAGYSIANNKQVNFTFYHQLTKVQLMITAELDLDRNSLTASFLELNTQAGFDLRTGAIEGMCNPVSITLQKLPSDTVFEAILLPQPVTGGKILLTWKDKENNNGSKEILLTSPQDWSSGTYYLYDIRLEKPNSVIDDWRTVIRRRKTAIGPDLP